MFRNILICSFIVCDATMILYREKDLDWDFLHSQSLTWIPFMQGSNKGPYSLTLTYPKASSKELSDCLLTFLSLNALKMKRRKTLQTLTTKNYKQMKIPKGLYSSTVKTKTLQIKPNLQKVTESLLQTADNPLARVLTGKQNGNQRRKLVP